ncbi:transposase [Humisphaera borealis]|uniref:Transposase n=1 Tax=Humisphaera borealis TaxID=2807512 RepID=A0A7M2WYK3_9BACT|nr:transposase [Humisphaera borealis]
MDQPDKRATKTRKAFNTPGHAHELTFSCNQRLPILNSDRCRQWFVESLDRARQKLDFELWAYVVMPEHVHVLLLPRREVYEMAAILTAIKLPVARQAVGWLRESNSNWLEKLKVCRPNGRIEYRFWQQGGGYDRNIFKLDAIWSAVRYIHDNPVRRGLVRNSIDWPWSSARAYEGADDIVLPIVDRPPFI